MAFQIGDTVGEYEVIGVLGAGGMGKVYKVRNMISDRVEAMKVLLPNLADEPQLADRFIREIKVLASLNHPNIASLYTALRFENQLVMIVEFAEGDTLEDLLKLGRIPLQEGIEYIRQALAALGYAHAKGVVHRDVKPANLMRSPQGVIKLMDFGIAKSTADLKLTATGMTMGSLHYMSPEQVKGVEVDARSDLYSVGVTLYKLVTGVLPFQGLSQYDLMLAQIQQAPLPPIQVDASIPPAINEITLRALEKDPAMRFQTAEEFRAALENAMPAQQTGATATALLETPRAPSQPPQISAPQEAVAPSPATPVPLPVSLPMPLSPATSRRSLYLVVGAVLAIVLVAFSTIELAKFLATHRRAPATRVEGVSKETKRPLPHFLAFPSGDMVLVEAGEALVGKDRHSVRLKSFYIDRTEVTNQAYLMFCRETHHPVPPGAAQAPPDYPVVNITFPEARDFALWAKKRLPSAVEWEKAARGTSGQSYPWGNDLRFELANIPFAKAAGKSIRLASASAYASGGSPYGALNMLGNAWEWIDTPAVAPAGAEFKNYAEMFSDLAPVLVPTEPFYEVRGGSYRYTPDDPTALIWDSSPVPARARKPDIGFRCVRDVKP